MHNRFPDGVIDVLTDEQYAEVYSSNPHVRNVYRIQKTWELSKIIAWKHRIPHYDYIVDLQNTLLSRIIRKGKGRKIFKYHKDRFRKLCIVYTPINPYKHLIPIPDRYRRTLASLGVEDDGKGLELWLPEERNSPFYPPESRSFMSSEGQLHIAIAPGARHYTKRWLPDYYAELAKRLATKRGAVISIIGAKYEENLCTSIAAQANVPAAISLKCSHSIYDTARHLDSCSLVISNDSAVVHIAAARRVPVVDIFGSTVPEFGFIPYRVPYKICQVDKLTCRPCTHYGRSRCPKGHFNCMKELSVDIVESAVHKLLQENYY